MTIAEGRYFTDEEVERKQKVAVLGPRWRRAGKPIHRPGGAAAAPAHGTDL
jgi:hypothetical protein